MKRDRLCGMAALCLTLAAGLANADTILYANDFQQGAIGPEWSSNSILVSEGVFTRFNGRYGNDSTILTLGAVPPPGGDCGGGDDDNGGGDGGGDGGDNGGHNHHGGTGNGDSNNARCGWIEYTLRFDFYTIDSWDGDYRDHGPDRFEVRLDAQGMATETLMRDTFANNHPYQTFRQPDIARQQLGFNAAWVDSIYREISLDFTLPNDAESFSLTFQGVGLQSLNDESWGIDNVSINYRAVPAPSTLTAGGLLLALTARRRR